VGQNGDKILAEEKTWLITKQTLNLRLITREETKTRLSMYLTKEKKEEIFATHGEAKTNTGSSEAQVALFTERINHLTEHLKINKKDHSTRLGLLRLVGKRRRILDSLHRNEIERYRAIIAKLGIRK
jgi:small subunit ribosomal protein S15